MPPTRRARRPRRTARRPAVRRRVDLPPRPSPGCPSTCASSTCCPAPGSRWSARAPWPRRPGSARPSCARTSPTSARTAPAASATTSRSCGARSVARWAPHTSGRWSSSGSATWVRALAGYSGFSSRGFRIVALVDPNPDLVGSEINGVEISDLADLEDGRRPHQGRRSPCSPPRPRPRRPWPTGWCIRASPASSTLQRPFSPCRRRHRTEGGPRSGAADPGLPRAAQVRRGQPARPDAGVRRGEQSMSILASACRTRPTSWTSWPRSPWIRRPRQAGRAAARQRPRRRGGRPVHLQPHRDLRLGLPLPRRPGRRHRRAGRPAGLGVAELRQMCAVYFDEGAVAHTFAVAAGLDSMVVGENQILGQVKAALTACQTARHRRHRAQRAVPAGAAGRQAGADRDRDRLGRSLPGQRRVRAAGRRARADRRSPAAGRRRRADGRPGRPDRRGGRRRR